MSSQPITPEDDSGDEARAVSRRRVLGAAAWSAPAIVVAAAAPAVAFSGLTAVVVDSFTAARGAFTGGTPFYYWSGATSGYTATSTAPTTIAANSVANLSLSGIRTSGGSGTGFVTIQVTVPANGAPLGVNRPAGQYGAVSSGWTLAGPPPSINTLTRAVTFTFTSGVVSVGTTLPNLSFAVTNSNTAGTVTYTWDAGLILNATSSASQSLAPATLSLATLT
ncbi:hypothetical protein [Nocardioides marinquilinus]